AAREKGRLSPARGAETHDQRRVAYLGQQRLGVGLSAEEISLVPEGVEPHIGTLCFLQVRQSLGIEARKADAPRLQSRLREAGKPIIQQYLTGSALFHLLQVDARGRATLQKPPDLGFEARQRGGFPR